MHPEVEACLRKFVGGEEFLNGRERWCLWLVGVSPTQIRHWTMVRERVEAVRRYRGSSGRATTQKLAEYPTLFGENRQPETAYLLLPKVSSENRPYVPIGVYGPAVVASGSALIIPNGSLYHLGVLSSTMHMEWMRFTGGRLESRYQYSSQIVYNNFPWPDAPSDAQQQKIEAAAQGVLDARAKFPDASLADLYDPLTMPPALVKAHHQLDAAVDAAYGKRSFRNDAERVAFLFELYRKYTSLLPASGKPTAKRKPAKKRPA